MRNKGGRGPHALTHTSMTAPRSVLAAAQGIHPPPPCPAARLPSLTLPQKWKTYISPNPPSTVMLLFHHRPASHSSPPGFHSSTTPSRLHCATSQANPRCTISPTLVITINSSLPSRLKSEKSSPHNGNMPSFSRHSTMPTVIHTKAPSISKKDRSVGFHEDPVTHVSRPVTHQESWAAYDFELHAQKCAYCRDPYEVHRNKQHLCERGHSLAQDVAAILYNHKDGETYSTAEEDNKLVRVEIPSAYVQVRGLLKAIERSLRHRSRTPFVSMDKTYFIPARQPTRARSVKIEQSPKSRPRSGEIVDWPGEEVRLEKSISVPHSKSKRGSLYDQDLANQRRNASRYNVEVREPSRRDFLENRLSGYYR
ncbi:unnamed protein product [Periconia digitata]|uniref:Uncharacterized protein n=1 Tax=Periconia digitata TaxID=1303443 RepID=A0A9W4U9W4_9PLEO|nr:unnamed protein product [Periconia digitata]